MQVMCLDSFLVRLDAVWTWLSAGLTGYTGFGPDEAMLQLGMVLVSAGFGLAKFKQVLWFLGHTGCCLTG